MLLFADGPLANNEAFYSSLFNKNQKEPLPFCCFLLHLHPENGIYNKHMRRTFTSLLTILVLAIGAAYGQNSLNVILKDGGAMTYSFQEKPVVTYTQDGVHLTTTRVEVDFPFQNLEKFTFDDDTADALCEVRSLNDPANTGIYTIDGKLLRTIKAREEGSTSFSLDDLPRGIYVIKNGNTTHKISKR